MISASLEGRLPYMTYSEPWRGPPKEPPEFLRPAPKPGPAPPTSRYNGVPTSPNGHRLPSTPRKYPSPTSTAITTPGNLAPQHKDDIVEELPSYYRMYPSHLPPFPAFNTLYTSPYPHMMRSNYHHLTTPLPSLDTYSPPSTINSSTTFLSPPPSTFSPPSPIKPGQSVLRDKRLPPVGGFKVPSGKEGSLKHRILTRPEDVNRSVAAGPLDLQKADLPRKRLNAAATLSPPRSPKKFFNNNSPITGNFTKGSLIQLSNGELRRIEDMRTEDFVSSAEHSPELRLADSTVVRIEENHSNGTATITLSYNQRRTQVEVESSVEHPFFVFGQGWASCSPEKTQQCYQLKVHRLQVGDILISLTPREQFPRAATVLTTCTSTAMTARPLPRDTTQPMNLHTCPEPGARKRSLEACDEGGPRRHRAE